MKKVLSLLILFANTHALGAHPFLEQLGFLLEAGLKHANPTNINQCFPPPAFALPEDIRTKITEDLTQKAPGADNALTKKRSLSNTLGCEKQLLGDKEEVSFSDVIDAAVHMNLLFRNKKPLSDDVYTAYNLPKEGKAIPENPNPNFSLISQKLCPFSKKRLRGSQKKDKSPVPGVAKIYQDFADSHNEIHEAFSTGNPLTKIHALASSKKLYFKFFSALALKESLTSSEKTTEKSRTLARAHGVTKHPGVKHYYDATQDDPASQFNIGLFQFSPDSSGNIVSCIENWNHQFPNCQIELKSLKSKSARDKKMAKILGSSDQLFNAYCGVNKIVQTFYVQAHTKDTLKTAEDNQASNGKLLPPTKRCVTPHIYKGWGYNHFGPLQNTTGTNLGELANLLKQSGIGPESQGI